MVTEPGNGEKRSVNLGDPEQLFAALLAELQQQGARIDVLNSVAESLAETDSGAAETVKAIGLLLHTQTFVLAALLGAVRQGVIQAQETRQKIVGGAMFDPRLLRGRG